MGPLLLSEDKTLVFSLKWEPNCKDPGCTWARDFLFYFYFYLNEPGRALEHGSKSIVMKGRGISCASISSSVVNYGRVSLSLVLWEASVSGWQPKIAPSAGTLAQFTALRTQPGAAPPQGTVGWFPTEETRLWKHWNPTSAVPKETTRPYLPPVRTHIIIIAASKHQTG